MFKVIHPSEKFGGKVGCPSSYFLFERPKHVIFLAGPCPRKDYEKDWRFEAEKYLQEAGFDGIVFNPTNPYFDKNDPLYLEKQTEWEQNAMFQSDKVVFWIPRTKEDPAFTTNIELGAFLNKEKIYNILIGWPDYAEKNNYIEIRLKWLNKYHERDLKTLMYRVVEELK